ncbi:MAG: cytochrome C oxidase subunit IV family protein [Flavobacteriaceae bacterium]
MKKLNITLAVLILLTVFSAVTSKLEMKHAAIALLVLAVIKFIGIAFYFMDLRKAHTFWKVAILIFLLIFTTSILLLG